MNHFYILVFSIPITLLAQQNKYPPTLKQNVTDDYFGVKVEDPYRWLEDDRSPETGQWVKQQNETTEAYLSAIPAREKIRSRLTALWNYNKESAPLKKGNYFFYFRNNGIQNQSVLFIKDDLSRQGTMLLDPNILSGDGTISLNGISISNDGKVLAYGVSKAGSDWTEIHFRDIATRKDFPDTVRWVKFSGMSWKGNGIYYSRYAEPSGSGLTEKNKFHKVYYHLLGTRQENDILVYEDKDHPDYNFGATVTDDERFLFISISESTSGEKLLVKDLTAGNNKNITISGTFDYDYHVIDNIDETIYMVTNFKAPNYKLVSFTINSADPDGWKTILPEGKSLLEGVAFCNMKIIANYLENVSSHLYCFSLDGKQERKIELPPFCRISALNSDKKFDFATYGIVQFTSPEKVFYLDAKSWTSKIVFKPDCKFDSEKYITEQVFYPSKDGTKIPMFITHKKGLKMTENTPCFVFGYGGFNISLAPEFRIDRAVFLEAGGIYCVPNIRGGGEYGEDWHKAGTKCRKQNVFDDFIAACNFLVSKKYTSHQKIAIHGRSNGGLLVGAVMTQSPGICRVAVPAVGVLDMLRFHKFTIGRAWSVDYGNSENKEEFECLIKYSPLQNVRQVDYPATLILTGDHDDRVVPAHSFKFAAALQEKSTGKNPVLIRIDVNAGHGSGKPTGKQINEFADMWSFVFYNLGILAGS